MGIFIFDSDEIEDMSECHECAGAGFIPVRGVIRGCPCCKESELFRKCKVCNGKGIVE